MNIIYINIYNISYFISVYVFLCFLEKVQKFVVYMEFLCKFAVFLKLVSYEKRN